MRSTIRLACRERERVWLQLLIVTRTGLVTFVFGLKGDKENQQH